MNEEFKNELFNVRSEKAFHDLAIKIFRYQAENNAVYRDYLSYLGKKPESIKDLYDLPFLPINFFRNHKGLSYKRNQS